MRLMPLMAPGAFMCRYMGSKQKKQIFIDITDTGKGIPRSKFDTVFQPGYTTRQRGLGAWIIAN
jgi:two-component system, sporulation sensor kinase D